MFLFIYCLYHATFLDPLDSCCGFVGFISMCCYSSSLTCLGQAGPRVWANVILKYHHIVYIHKSTIKCPHFTARNCLFDIVPNNNTADTMITSWDHGRGRVVLAPAQLPLLLMLLSSSDERHMMAQDNFRIRVMCWKWLKHPLCS